MANANRGRRLGVFVYLGRVFSTLEFAYKKGDFGKKKVEEKPPVFPGNVDLGVSPFIGS